MPNTLAHLAVHGLSTRALISGADLRWIYLGAVIPDLPWILRRALVALMGFQDNNLPQYLYAIVQSSLLFCLVLCAGLALLNRKPMRTFAILSLGSLVHLLLDACQDKIGNGVLLFAPLSWEVRNFHLFPVESWPSYLLTLAGLAYLLVKLPEVLKAPLELNVQSKSVLLAAALILLYLIAPMGLRNAAFKADVRDLKTLYSDAPRTGKRVGFDREDYLVTDRGTFVKWSVGKELSVEGIDRAHPVTISGWATFVTQDRIRVEGYQVHPKGVRDYFSITGLLLIGGIWFWSLLRWVNRRKVPS